MTTIHRWRAFAVLAVSFFMTIVDLTIVNVALPTIGRKLHFSESNLQWVITAYGLTFGGFLLLGGRAADLLGRRRILMVGLGVFTAGVARVRPRDHRRLLDRDARYPGPWCGDRAAGGAVDRDEHVRRGPRAEQGARHLGRHRRGRGDLRPDRRRAAHPLRRMGVHLLPQRADRRSGAGDRAAGRARKPARHRPSPLRPVRRAHRHRRAAAARVHDLASTTGWLGVGANSDLVRSHRRAAGGVSSSSRPASKLR